MAIKLESRSVKASRKHRTSMERRASLKALMAREAEARAQQHLTMDGRRSLAIVAAAREVVESFRVLDSETLMSRAQRAALERLSAAIG